MCVDVSDDSIAAIIFHVFLLSGVLCFAHQRQELQVMLSNSLYCHFVIVSLLSSLLTLEQHGAPLLMKKGQVFKVQKPHVGIV